jgi:hypothetical protein
MLSTTANMGGFSNVQREKGSRRGIEHPPPLKDRYQKEVYRCLSLVWPMVLVSPELIVPPQKSGTSAQQGTVDFYLHLPEDSLESDEDRLNSGENPCGWAIELLRDMEPI